MQFENATQAVSIAIRAIFERWTALKLVVDHQFNGAPYQANQLLQAATEMATSTSKRYTNDDYTDLFYSMFEKVNADIEDGSPEEVATQILRVRDAAAAGNFAPATELVEKAGISNQAVQASLEGANDSDDEGRYAAQTGPVTRSQTRPQGAQQQVIDEDGFTQVRPRRRQH